MSLPDLYGTLYPDFSRFYQAQWIETGHFPIYQGDTFNGDLIIFNDGTEPSEAFDVDLYISTDPIIDSSDRYLGTYTFADGIDGESFYSTLYDFPRNPATLTLPNSEDTFWQDRETYYLGAIVDPDNAIEESDESNNTQSNPDSQYSYFNYHTSKPITIQQGDLPVVSFTQHDNTLQINLSEPAPESGFTIDYQNITREDYLNGINIRDSDSYQYWHRRIGSRYYDPEYNRFYVTRESYYDLSNYKYYDGNGGHYDPAVDRYFNADGSYYDVGNMVFYDAQGNATELTDNSAEYINYNSNPRHYLATGGYISLISGIYYYKDGYYQLFVRVTDEIPTEDDFLYSSVDLHETTIVNVQVADIPTTPGNDEVLGSIDNDFIKGKDGDDTINGLKGNDTINGGDGRDFLFGSVGNDVLIGSLGHDTLNGGEDDDTLLGSHGQDLLLGSNGNDFINGGLGYDKLNGGMGDDTLVGLYGKDTLDGMEGDDVLKGYAQDDLLRGGMDDDTLIGGAGLDTLVGNEGEDIFVLQANSGQDLILDFEDEVDLIDIPNNMSFGQLNIVDLSLYSATIIQDGDTDEVLAVLKGVEKDLITAADFV
ncbi:MAG: CARDB domain-containing protein [Cyanobacteria bacterium P01_G01_bin.19]